MDIAKSIKDLRESTGMSRKEFSEHTGIPVRTLEDWEAGRRTPPEYIPRLLAYQIRRQNSRTMATVMVIKQKTNGIDMIQGLGFRFIVKLVKYTRLGFASSTEGMVLIRTETRM